MTPHLLSRRHFLGTTLAAATGFTLPRFASAAEKPNSVFNGVRVGCITYSYRSMAKTAEETLKALVDCGISETELMGGPTQLFAGIKGGKITDAEREQQIAKCVEMRKMFNDAGVNIHIHKMGFGQSNEEIEFSFLVAKALGCKVIGIAGGAEPGTSCCGMSAPAAPQPWGAVCTGAANGLAAGAGAMAGGAIAGWAAG
jgi:hypothetical protein